MKEYWDKRFQAEGNIWGDSPSRTAVHALKIFRQTGVKSVLVPGSGYGRNTKLFSESGLKVTGVEISPTAYALALKFDKLSRFYNASALDMSFLPGKYEAVYCANLLHLFREKDRNLLIEQCMARTRTGGLMFFTVFSEKDRSYGKGQEVEKNTFESKPGRPAHYFTESDLKIHFGQMEIMKTGIIEDPEDHGEEGPHMHPLRYICVKI